VRLCLAFQSGLLHSLFPGEETGHRYQQQVLCAAFCTSSGCLRGISAIAFEAKADDQQSTVQGKVMHVVQPALPRFLQGTQILNAEGQRFVNLNALFADASYAGCWEGDASGPGTANGVHWVLSASSTDDGGFSPSPASSLPTIPASARPCQSKFRQAPRILSRVNLQAL